MDLWAGIFDRTVRTATRRIYCAGVFLFISVSPDNWIYCNFDKIYNMTLLFLLFFGYNVFIEEQSIGCRIHRRRIHLPVIGHLPEKKYEYRE